MGHYYSAYIGSPDTAPNPFKEPTYDPLYGFPNGRKERQMVATEAEMEAAGLTAEERDYCAHKLIDFMKCRKQKFPYAASCKHERHVWEQCQYEDFVLRMKEHERERRLMVRSKKKGEAFPGQGEVMVEWGATYTTTTDFTDYCQFQQTLDSSLIASAKFYMRHVYWLADTLNMMGH